MSVKLQIEKEIENNKINLLEDKINLLEDKVNKLENIILTTICNNSNNNSKLYLDNISNELYLDNISNEVNLDSEVNLDNTILYRGIDYHITEPKIVRQHAFHL